MKKIPIGINDFKTLIENNYYYIDKTKHIEDLLEDGSEVILFTRPRRFGKTLNMSMIKYFFDIENKEENKKLFTNLYIEKSKYISEQGKYPVIYISFKDLKSKNWEGTIFKLKNQLKDLYKEFLYLKDSLDEISQEDFNKIIYMKEDANYEFSLKYLTEYLYKYYKQKVIVIIDEYDSPIVNSYENNYYDEAILFFRNFYSSVLKDNQYLERGFLTGILRVAKEGIFSGLNNLEICSILDNKYSSFYGLTEDEVLKSLDFFNMEYKLNEVKDWYDGYKFGNKEIYNPWSILNYINKKEIGAYWVGTSNNFLINNILENAEASIFEELELLFSDKRIEKTIYSDSNFYNIRNPQEIWQLLLHTGYLTTKEKLDRNFYSLIIPNKEIKDFFERSFIGNFLGNEDTFKMMLNALLKKDIVNFENNLQKILELSFSYYDIGSEEKFYHNFILGMVLSLSDKYYVKSNRESGYGRYDILLEPRNQKETAFILEFKVAKTETEIDSKIQEALKQIEDKKYDIELKNKNIFDIFKIAFVFYGKKVKVKNL